MKLGLQLPWYDGPMMDDPSRLRDGLADVAQLAEEAGFATLWVMDHLFQIEFESPPFRRPGRPDQPMLEAYTTLGYLARCTSRIELGAMVTAATYRAPGLLVKEVSTLDVLSGGRAWLGLGAGWYEQEARGLGLPFPELTERYRVVAETVQLARQMWAGDATPFVGRSVRADQPINSPVPLRRPPVLIGGSGERVTLRLVAEYADACNLELEPDEVAGKLAVLRRHCEQVGRNFDEIERTALGTIHLADDGHSPKQVIDMLHRAADAGIQHAILNMENAYELAPLRTIADTVLPAVAAS